MSIDNIHRDYKEFFNTALFNQRGKKYDNIFYIAIDAEWHDIGGKNNVLSYQIATVSKNKADNIIKFMKYGQRLTLSELVQLGVKSVTTEKEFKNLRGTHNIVNLISHNLTAEWSVLADRDEPDITKRIELIRKSPVTGRSYIKKAIDKSFMVSIRLFDTMLLAPAAYKSLKKLSGLLGDKDNEKESITQHHIENMHLFLEKNLNEYRKYALKDTEITLKLFFLLQDSLNRLVQTEFKLHRTLASVGVKDFLNKNEWFKDYKDTLNSEKFKSAFNIIKRSYYGGRNESYFVGKTNNYPQTKDKFWIDIDFSGCYPTTMALCPKIDLNDKVEHYPLTYKIDNKTTEELKYDGIAPDIINKIINALQLSQNDFNQVLAGLPNKKIAGTIRSKATVVNNRLINRWYRKWKAAAKSNNSAENYIIPGFARIHFKFPEDTLFPCLPIRHEKYGVNRRAIMTHF